jgi:hypothetical protein
MNTTLLTHFYQLHTETFPSRKRIIKLFASAHSNITPSQGIKLLSIVGWLTYKAMNASFRKTTIVSDASAFIVFMLILKNHTF